MIPITDLQRDAICEILNIAIGHAAAALNQMVEEEVRLSVPFIDFSGRQEAGSRLKFTASEDAVTVAVKQRFRGQFAGDIMLIFPERKSLDLVRSFIGDVPLEAMTELEHDALLEVGNVILNACLGSLANQLGQSLESSLPMYVRGSGEEILEAAPVAGDQDIVMFLHVDFTLARRNLSGYVAFVMDILSAESFRQQVDRYIAATVT